MKNKLFLGFLWGPQVRLRTLGLQKYFEVFKIKYMMKLVDVLLVIAAIIFLIFLILGGISYFEGQGLL